MDKNKIIEAAAKLVAKGAYDKAIKEYQKVLDLDPKDVRVLQKVGELFQKKNENAQAAQYFTRVAEAFTTDGFFLKAVALYKQVLKLDPGLVDVNLKLAELHQQLQLMGEAMAYYQVVANHWDKQGDTKRSLDVLRKMVELDPENVASRVKLADLYVREGLNEEAAGEFSRAAEYLKRNGRVDDYLRVAERLSALQPDNLQLAKELAETYLQKSDQKRALAKLQVCFKADNRDIETLRLLAIAFQGLGQMSKTISVFKELARAYEDKGYAAEAAQVWQQVEQLDPSDPDVVAHQQGASGSPEAAPEAAPAQPSFPRSSPSQSTTMMQSHQPAAPRPRATAGDNLGKLLTETDVYVKYGLHDKALEHLRKVFALDPENIDAHEKAYAIYVASGNQAQAFEQLLNVLRLHTRTGDAVRAQPYLTTILQTQPGHEEVPVFLSALRIAGAAMAAPQASSDQEAEDAILVDSSEDEVIVADEAEEFVSAEVQADVVEEELAAAPSDEVLLSASDAEAAAQVDVDPPPVPDEYETTSELDANALRASVQPEAPPADGRYDDALYDTPDGEPSTGQYSFGEEEAPVEQTGDLGIPVRTEPASESESPQDEALEGPTSVAPRMSAAMLRGAPEPEMGAEEEPPTAATPLPEMQLEAVDDAPAWAGDDGAPAEPVDPALPEGGGLAPSGYEGEAALGAVATLDGEPSADVPPEEEPAGEECDEATFFLEQGLYDEAREILETVLIAYPEHRRAAALLARVEAEQSGGAAAAEGSGEASAGGEAGEGRDAFDIAAELANELGDLSQEGAGEAGGGAGAGDEYQVSVEEVFAEFKKGLEKVVKPEDVDTHYDLGVAYKEMGLVDDAIGEFSIARKGCLGKRKEIDCLSMIGMLQLQRGDSSAAVEAYLQGLASEHSAGDVEKSLRYELAAAYEVAGQQGRALAEFLKVQQLDAGYRDTGAHVERLSAITAPEEDGPQVEPAPPAPRGGGARKVGYV